MYSCQSLFFCDCVTWVQSRSRTTRRLGLFKSVWVLCCGGNLRRHFLPLAEQTQQSIITPLLGCKVNTINALQIVLLLHSLQCNFSWLRRLMDSVLFICFRRYEDWRTPHGRPLLAACWNLLCVFFFCGTQRLIAILTITHYCKMSWNYLIQPKFSYFSLYLLQRPVT